MAASGGSKSEAMAQCQKVLTFFKQHKDAGPFLEPVRWHDWGLMDYPKVIKHPMDLSTIQTKVDRGEYSNPLEFERDVNLVWDNCMTYNQDGSEYYTIAANLKQMFAEKFKKVKIDPSDVGIDNRQPTLADKKAFAQNIYMIGSEDLGKLVQILDSRCDTCIKKIDPDDIEIDIDTIDPATFWVVDQFVTDCLGGSSRRGGAVKKQRLA